MRLPNHEQANVPEAKIVAYLLNLGSRNGASKARFFLAFGFTIERWHVMAEALKDHARANEVTEIVPRPFGLHYVVEGPLQTPDGRDPSVRVVWIIESDEGIPRLLSAYPL